MKKKPRLAICVFVYCCAISLSVLASENYLEMFDQIADGSRDFGKPARNVSLLTGTDEGGTLALFLGPDKINKIVVNIGLSNMDVERIFYYHEDKLLAALENYHGFGYNEAGGTIDRSKVIRSATQKFYFADGKLAFWSTERRLMSVGENDFQSMNETLLRQFAFFIQALNASPNATEIDVEALLK